MVFSDSFPALQEVHISVSCWAFRVVFGKSLLSFHCFTGFIIIVMEVGTENVPTTDALVELFSPTSSPDEEKELVYSGSACAYIGPDVVLSDFSNQQLANEFFVPAFGAMGLGPEHIVAFSKCILTLCFFVKLLLLVCH